MSRQLPRLWHLDFESTGESRRFHWLAGAKLHGATMQAPPGSNFVAGQPVEQSAMRAMTPGTSGLALVNLAIWNTYGYGRFFLVSGSKDFPELLASMPPVQRSMRSTASAM